MTSVQYGGRIFVVCKPSDRTVSDLFIFLLVLYTETMLRLACLSQWKE